MLKNDTLKNGTSRIGLYGSAPPPPGINHSKMQNVKQNWVLRFHDPQRWPKTLTLNRAHIFSFLPFQSYIKDCHKASELKLSHVRVKDVQIG